MDGRPVSCCSSASLFYGSAADPRRLYVRQSVDFSAVSLSGNRDHIRDAIAEGHSDICTIDRGGADKRRQESLIGIPTKPGYDRDEWPMAVCEEGGAGADVRYVTPSDNRGAGSWVGNQMSGYPDGTRVLFIVQ